VGETDGKAMGYLPALGPVYDRIREIWRDVDISEA
jgi:hypothetical protein